MSSIEEAVCEKIRQRAKVGRQKYDATMDRTDLTDLEWLVHLQEELMDGVVYAEKVIQLLRLVPVDSAICLYCRQRPPAVELRSLDACAVCIQVALTLQCDVSEINPTDHPPGADPLRPALSPGAAAPPRWVLDVGEFGSRAAIAEINAQNAEVREALRRERREAEGKWP
jgi:hypothetical protein